MWGDCDFDLVESIWDDILKIHFVLNVSIYNKNVEFNLPAAEASLAFYRLIALDDDDDYCLILLMISLP